MQLFKLFVILAVLGLAVPASATIGCLNHKGEVVDWFVIITTPGKIHTSHPEFGYLYFDSKFKNNTFQRYRGYGNELNAPIHRTISQGNKTHLLSAVWNDQLLSQQGVGDTDDAHSKSYLVMNEQISQGYLMDHSVPKYPYIDEEGRIQPRINEGQRKMAQHHFCISINRKELAEEIYKNACFMNPNIYHNNLFESCKKYAGKDIVKFYDFKSGKFSFKTIFKNGYRQIVNGKLSAEPPFGGIFELGVTKSLESSIIIQTFSGPNRPICEGEYHVGMVNSINLSKDVFWTAGSDHCKWVYARDNDYSCFGDLNHNTDKQRKRGGAFYCVESPYLNSALKSISPYADKC